MQTQQFGVFWILIGALMASDLDSSVRVALEGRVWLMRHLGIMVLLCALVQGLIALRGNEVDLIAQLMWGIVVVYYGWDQYKSSALLAKLRFGRLVSHVVGFMVVNLSYHLHAFILVLVGSDALNSTNDHLPLDGAWFGALIGMPLFWGIGLLMHLTASIWFRGFEDLNRGQAGLSGK